MKDKDNHCFSRRVRQALELSEEALPKSIYVEINGRGTAKIIGGGAILLYSPEEIRIGLTKDGGYLSIRGKALNCSSYNMGAVGVAGLIGSISFEEDDNGR